MSARFALLHDLASNGITDVVAMEFGLNKAPLVTKMAAPAKSKEQIVKETQAIFDDVHKQSATPVVAPVKAAPKPEVKAPADKGYRVQPAKLIEVLLPLEETMIGKLPLTTDEQSLLSRMLGAIGIDMAEVGISVVDGKLPEDLRINLPVFAFGERAAQLMHKGESKPLAALRTQHAGSCTFHPRAILSQPELFRPLAWADLQALQKRIGVN